MNVVFKGQATIYADQEGNHYFHHGETTWYLEDFMKSDPKNNLGYSAGTHISNTGGILINVNESEESVDYAIVTI
jgi:hypothetical protein